MIRRLKNFFHKLLALFVSLYYLSPAKKITIIGITGTDGKTTTSHLLYEILKHAGKKVSLISSVCAIIGDKKYDTGFHVTTPSSFFLQKTLREALQNKQDYLVLEVTSHALDQHRIFKIPFKIGILTNITHEHLDYHGDYDSYLQTKAILLKNSEIAIINREDSSFTRITELVKKESKKKIITYGLKKGDLTQLKLQLKTRLPGNYNIYNVLAAYGAAKELLIEESVIRKAISSFKGVEGRYEEIANDKNIRIIVDFAHTPNALKQVLETARKDSFGNVIHVFGCAGLRDYLKRPVMGGISKKYSEISIITEEDYRSENLDEINLSIISGMKRNEDKKEGKHQYFVINNRYQAIKKAIQIAKKNDTVIITGKGHEKSLCRGKKEYPWSDCQAIVKALI